MLAISLFFEGRMRFPSPLYNFPLNGAYYNSREKRKNFLKKLALTY